MVAVSLSLRISAFLPSEYHLSDSEATQNKMSSEAQEEMEAEAEKEPYSEDEVAEEEEDENTILSHQVAMEQFKDCLAELIVVSQNFSNLIMCTK